MDYIAFWENDHTGNLLNHRKGLTKDQIEFLQSLKEGDRVILYAKDKDNTSETAADFKFKKYPKRAEDYE